MRVAFAGYYLCGDYTLNQRENPQAQIVSKSADRLTQVVDGPGWSVVDTIDRGNQQTTLVFKSERVFETVQEAESYMLGYEAAGHHPWDQSTLLMVLDVPGGIKYHYLFPAAISPPSFSYMGCRVFAQYTVTGGQITAVADYSASYWFRPDGDRAPTGEKSTLADEAFQLLNGDLFPKASIVSDANWQESGGDFFPKA